MSSAFDEITHSTVTNEITSNPINESEEKKINSQTSAATFESPFQDKVDRTTGLPVSSLGSLHKSLARGVEARNLGVEFEGGGENYNNASVFATLEQPPIIISTPPLPPSAASPNNNSDVVIQQTSATILLPQQSPSSPSITSPASPTSQNNKLQQQIGTYQKQLSNCQQQLAQKERECSAYATRVEALQKQLEMEIDQRKALQLRLSKVDGKKKEGETNTVLIAYIKKLEGELEGERKTGKQMFLEREDELLSKMERQKERFNKVKDGLLDANAKLLGVNKALLTKLSKGGGSNDSTGLSINLPPTPVKMDLSSDNSRIKKLQALLIDVIPSDKIPDLSSSPGTTLFDAAKECIARLKQKLEEEKLKGQDMYLEREDELLGQIAEQRNNYKRKLIDFKKKNKVLNKLLLEKGVKDLDDEVGSDVEIGSAEKKMRI